MCTDHTDDDDDDDEADGDDGDTIDKINLKFVVVLLSSYKGCHTIRLTTKDGYKKNKSNNIAASSIKTSIKFMITDCSNMFVDNSILHWIALKDPLFNYESIET